jgi:hypothetical protein
MTLVRTTCQQDEHGLKIPQYLYVFHPLLNLIRSSHKRAENSGQVHLQRKVFRAVVSLDGHFLTRDGLRGSRPVLWLCLLNSVNYCRGSQVLAFWEPQLVIRGDLFPIYIEQPPLYACTD